MGLVRPCILPRQIRKFTTFDTVLWKFGLAVQHRWTRPTWNPFRTSRTRPTIQEESSAARIKVFPLLASIPTHVHRPLFPKARKSKTVPQQPLRQSPFILLLIFFSIYHPHGLRRDCRSLSRGLLRCLVRSLQLLARRPSLEIRLQIPK